jgi:hypothetical protein
MCIPLQRFKTLCHKFYTSKYTTAEHLFFEYPFSEWCWRLVDINWDLTVPLLKRLPRERNSFGVLAIFMGIIVVAAWCIWSMQNGIIFDGKTLSL